MFERDQVRALAGPLKDIPLYYIGLIGGFLVTFLTNALFPRLLKCLSLAQVYLGSFSHSSLHILSRSVMLDGERRCTATFKTLQRCSIGFKSGLWLVHSMTFGDFS